MGTTRRDLLKLTTVSAALAITGCAHASPREAGGGLASAPARVGVIPKRRFGRTDASVSAIGIGGSHLGDAPDENEAIRIVHEAIDAGVNFFDNAWEYHDGKSEEILGRALAGKRQGAFLMTKVCTHGRDRAVAMNQLEDSLRRLKTDHLDLWQVHECIYDNDPELHFASGGVIEALEQAKKQGKVRHVGFTGHKDPNIHLAMLAHGFPFDSAQMPLNCFDASFRSFEQNVVPVAVKSRMAVIGMKSMGGAGQAIQAGVVTPEEALRYAMSIPGVTVTVSGIDSIDILRQNLAVARGFEPMTTEEMTAIGLGGHHLGDPKSYDECERIVHEAIDAGVTFFDNCWEYHNGRSEDWAGRAIASSGKRKDLFLMTKVCTHGRQARMALQMLDESLRRMRTDYLDLWQIHGVSFDNDPELAMAKGGVIEALDQAKRAGKVRFVGFTGHKDPSIHLKMIALGYPFDTVQMPLNCYDATWRSFEQRVVPEANNRGVAVLGMKPMTGKAGPVKEGDATAAEMLRYAMSLPVATTISGIDKLEHLHQNLEVARGFQPMSGDEMRALRERCRPKAADGRYELYKVSLQFDNPQARLAHGFPLDAKNIEVKEALENMTNLSPPRP